MAKEKAAKKGTHASNCQSTIDELRTKIDRVDQELLRLVYWDGLSHAEIAPVLDISVNAVAVRVHRARTRVKARLEEENKCRPT